MNHHAHSRLKRLMLLGASAASVSACAPLAGLPVAAGPVSKPSVTPPFQRMAQVNYGSDAAFAVCLVPACPVRTAKTLVESGQAAINGQYPSERFEVQIQRPVVLYFAPGASTLSNDARKELHRSLMLAKRAERIVIRARTDATGPSTLNASLAMARANNVNAFFRKHIPGSASVIEIDALPGNSPAPTTPKSNPSSRRAEVLLLTRINRSGSDDGA